MKLRIVACGAIGTIPMLGDLADTILKFNTQNAALLEKLLLKRSGYFEVIAKEKALRKSRTRHGDPRSRNQTIPPPRYESISSNHRVPSIQNKAPGTVEQPQRANAGQKLLSIMNSVKNVRPHEERRKPERPLRPEVAAY